MDVVTLEDVKGLMRTAGRRSLMAYARALMKEPLSQRAIDSVLSEGPACYRQGSPVDIVKQALKRQRSLKRHFPALYQPMAHFNLLITYGRMVRHPTALPLREEA